MFPTLLGRRDAAAHRVVFERFKKQLPLGQVDSRHPDGELVAKPVSMMRFKSDKHLTTSLKAILIRRQLVDAYVPAHGQLGATRKKSVREHS